MALLFINTIGSKINYKNAGTTTTIQPVSQFFSGKINPGTTTQTNLPYGVTYMAMDPTGKYICCQGGGGGIAYSNNFGSTWTIPATITAGNVYTQCISASSTFFIVVTGTTTNYIYYFSSPGWQSFTTNITMKGIGVTYTSNVAVAWNGANNTLYYSNLNGSNTPPAYTTWTQMSIGGSISSAASCTIACDISGRNIFYFNGSQGGNGGTTASANNNNIAVLTYTQPSTWTGIFKFVSTTNNIIYGGSVSQNGKYMLTSYIPNPGPPPPQYSNRAVYFSSNYGSTWTTILSGKSGPTVTTNSISSTGQYIIFSDNNTGLVYYSNNYGGSFSTAAVGGTSAQCNINTNALYVYIANTASTGTISPYN